MEKRLNTHPHKPHATSQPSRVSHVQTQHTLTAQPAQPLTAPHTHISSQHQHWHCKASIVTQTCFVGGFDCAVVFVVLGDAGPLLLSPCNTPTHLLHPHSSELSPCNTSHTHTRMHGPQTFQRGRVNSCAPVVRGSCPCCADRRQSESPTVSGHKPHAWQRWRPGCLSTGFGRHSPPSMAWPTVRTSQWSGHSFCQMVRCCVWQRCSKPSPADADAPVAAIFATLKADAGGPAARPKDQALADLSRLRSCSGVIASAWLTARPGLTELTAIEFCVNARLRLGETLLAGQDGGTACVCGRLMPAGGTHSLICGALWRTVVARHNGKVQAWCRAFSRCGVACALEPHLEQLPQFKRAAGLRALPDRDETTTIRADGVPKRADPPSHDDLQCTCASAVPSTPHGTQVLTNPSQPDLALTACPPVTAQPSEPRTTAQRQPAQQQQQQRHIPPHGQCSTRRCSHHTANAPPTGATCSRSCPDVRS